MMVLIGKGIYIKHLYKNNYSQSKALNLYIDLLLCPT